MTVARPQRTSRAQGHGVLLVVTVLLVVAAGGSAWVLVRPPLHREVHYATAAAMAERLGCRGDFRTVDGGSARSAGVCVTDDGVRLHLRVYAGRAQAQAWLDGAVGPSGVDAATTATAVGDGWAALLTGGTGPSARESLVAVLGER